MLRGPRDQQHALSVLQPGAVLCRTKPHSHWYKLRPQSIITLSTVTIIAGHGALGAPFTRTGWPRGRFGLELILGRTNVI